MHWDAMMNDLIKYECHSERSEESQSFKTQVFLDSICWQLESENKVWERAYTQDQLKIFTLCTIEDINSFLHGEIPWQSMNILW